MTRALALSILLAACGPGPENPPGTTTTPTGTGTTTSVPAPLRISPTRAVLLDTRTNDPVVIGFVADGAWQSFPVDAADLGFLDCTPPSNDPPSIEVPLDRELAANAPYLAEPAAPWGGEQVLLDHIAGIDHAVIPTTVGNDCDALAAGAGIQTLADAARLEIDGRIEALGGCVDRAGIAWCEAQAALDNPLLPVEPYCENLNAEPLDILFEDIETTDPVPAWCWSCRFALDGARSMAQRVDLQIASCERDIEALVRLRDEVNWRTEVGICIDDGDVDDWTDDAAALLERAAGTLDRVTLRYDAVINGLDACTPERLQSSCDGCSHDLVYGEPDPGWVLGSGPALEHAVRLADALDAAADATDAPTEAVTWPALADELRGYGPSDVFHIVVPTGAVADEALVVVGDGTMGLPRMVVIHQLPKDVAVTEEHTELVPDSGAWERALQVIGSTVDGGTGDTGAP